MRNYTLQWKKLFILVCVTSLMLTFVSCGSERSVVPAPPLEDTQTDEDESLTVEEDLTGEEWLLDYVDSLSTVYSFLQPDTSDVTLSGHDIVVNLWYDGMSTESWDVVHSFIGKPIWDNTKKDTLGYASDTLEKAQEHDLEDLTITMTILDFDDLSTPLLIVENETVVYDYFFGTK